MGVDVSSPSPLLSTTLTLVEKNSFSLALDGTEKVCTFYVYKEMWAEMKHSSVTITALSHTLIYIIAKIPE